MAQHSRSSLTPTRARWSKGKEAFEAEQGGGIMMIA